MKSKLIILGSGSSAGVPRIDGFWGNCKKNKKNIRTRCSAVILSGPNSILIDTSPVETKTLRAPRIINTIVLTAKVKTKIPKIISFSKKVFIF